MSNNNHFSHRIMGDHATKNESEEKMNEMWSNRNVWRQHLDRVLKQYNLLLYKIDAQERRIVALEKALISVTHTNTDDGSRHRNDGGWFD